MKSVNVKLWPRLKGGDGEFLCVTARRQDAYGRLKATYRDSQSNGAMQEGDWRVEGREEGMKKKKVGK